MGPWARHQIFLSLFLVGYDHQTQHGGTHRQAGQAAVSHVVGLFWGALPPIGFLFIDLGQWRLSVVPRGILADVPWG